MNKIIIVLFAVLVVALAEPPSSYGAPSFNSGSSGYDDSGSDGEFVDAELLARVAQILAQSESSSSSRGYSAPSQRSYQPPSNEYGAPPSNSYGAPSQRSYQPPSNEYGPPPSDSYGAPSRSGSSGISLGTPERAERVAEWSSSSSSGPSRSGGYNNGGYN